MKAKQNKSGKQQYTEVIPNAGRTMTALREMGYDSYASIMDLIDNSIDAGAKRIAITVKEAGKGSIVVDILDDGKGMDEETLVEALKLGSDIDHNDQKDLGKFGMGLVTASLSMARNIWVLTRQDGKGAFEATLDLETIIRENRFVIVVHPARSEKVVGTIDKHGTLVRLSMIDRINDTNVARFAGNLRPRLGRVYRHFLAKGIDILVNGRKVSRYDPLFLDHPETEVKLDTTFDLGDGTKGHLVVVDLPEFGTAGDAENDIFPHNSGFYVVRNGREIIAGETFGFYRHHHSYSHFRAELSYVGHSTVLHEDIKKSSIQPDDRLLAKLRKLTEGLIADAGRRGREEGRAVEPKLAHRSSGDVINSKLASLIQGPTKAALAEASQAVEAPLPEPTPAPRKRGRPSKEEAEKRAAQEKQLAEQKAKQPPAPSVEFVEVEGGDDVRFFTHETKGLKTTITYNSRHPFVRMVADSKQKQAHQILDLFSFALAKAEGDVPEGRKLLNRACDYLKVLAAPAVVKGAA